MAHRNRIASKNLDVRETSQDQETDCTKGIQRELASAPSLCATAAHPDEQPYHPQRRYRVGGTRYISVAQATNIIEAVEFAKLIDLPLVAHLTIHWAYTNVGDDPDGKRFAKVREGLAKWLRRHGIVFAGAWCIERMSRGQAEVCIATCSFTCRLSTAPRGSFKSRRPSIASSSGMVAATGPKRLST